MKVEIDFQSTNRFFMSSGLALIIIVIVLYFLFQPEKLLLVPIISILILGVYLFIYGIKELKRMEDLEKKLKFEIMLNQIIDQDLKLINIKNKTLEYNEKVRSIKENEMSIPLGVKELEETNHRGIESIIYQALNSQFYEQTYPKLIENIYKMKNK